jgi:anti-sigma B factor antagonist
MTTTEAVGDRGRTSPDEIRTKVPVYSNGLPHLRVSTASVRDADSELTVVTVDGPLTARTSSDLREPLRALHDSGVRRVLVDLSGVGFIDPAGLGVLVGALRRAQLADDDRTVTLVDLVGVVRSRARLTGLARILGLAVPDAPAERQSQAA